MSSKSTRIKDFKPRSIISTTSTLESLSIRIAWSPGMQDDALQLITPSRESKRREDASESLGGGGEVSAVCEVSKSLADG